MYLRQDRQTSKQEMDTMYAPAKDFETNYMTASGMDRYMFSSVTDSKSVCKYTKDGVTFEFRHNWDTNEMVYLRNGQPATKEEYLKFVCRNL